MQHEESCFRSKLDKAWQSTYLQGFAIRKAVALAFQLLQGLEGLTPDCAASLAGLALHERSLWTSGRLGLGTGKASEQAGCYPGL